MAKKNYNTHETNQYKTNDDKNDLQTKHGRNNLDLRYCAKKNCKYFKVKAKFLSSRQIHVISEDFNEFKMGSPLSESWCWGKTHLLARSDKVSDIIGY